MTSSDHAPAPLLIDRVLSRADFTRTAHVLVDADPPTVYQVLRELDLSDVHQPVLDAAKWVRRLPRRIRDRKHAVPRHPTRLTIGDLTAGTDWVLLGERPGSEIVFGAVGKFWRPVIELREIEARAFTDFAEPGYGKVACALTVLPYGERRSLLTYEMRVSTDDPTAWVRFRRYWRLAGPFMGVLERAVLHAVKTSAEGAWSR